LHEDYDLVNYSSNVIDLDLELRIAGDHAVLFDVKEHRLEIDASGAQTRKCSSAWIVRPGEANSYFHARAAPRFRS